MENLLWFECIMESGHNIKGVSRVEAPRIKHTVENCGKEKDIIKIGKYQEATKEQIKVVALEYGTDDIKKFMEENTVDIMFI